MFVIMFVVQLRPETENRVRETSYFYFIIFQWKTK